LEIDIKALKEAIAHHERLKKAQTRDEIKEEGIGEDGCPLCSLYIHLGCTGCPIMLHTGRDYCSNTPYDLLANCLDDYLDMKKPRPLAKVHQAEIDFLEKVLQNTIKELADVNKQRSKENDDSGTAL